MADTTAEAMLMAGITWTTPCDRCARPVEWLHDGPDDTLICTRCAEEVTPDDVS